MAKNTIFIKFKVDLMGNLMTMAPAAYKGRDLKILVNGEVGVHVDGF